MFFICISEEDRMKTKKIIQSIYSIMEDKELLRKIRKSESIEEILIAVERNREKEICYE